MTNSTMQQKATNYKNSINYERGEMMTNEIIIGLRVIADRLDEKAKEDPELLIIGMAIDSAIEKILKIEEERQ